MKLVAQIINEGTGGADITVCDPPEGGKKRSQTRMSVMSPQRCHSREGGNPDKEYIRKTILTYYKLSYPNTNIIYTTHYIFILYHK